MDKTTKVLLDVLSDLQNDINKIEEHEFTTKWKRASESIERLFEAKPVVDDLISEELALLEQSLYQANDPQVLNEGRLEDVKEKYAKLLNPDGERFKTSELFFNIVDEISKLDPSGNNKYLDWMVKFSMESLIIDQPPYINNFWGEIVAKVSNCAKVFHNNIDIYPDKNINSYEPEDIIHTYFLLKKKSDVKNEEIKQILEDIEIIHEDERFRVYFPKDYKQMRVLGKDATWCVAQKPPSGPSMWSSYTSSKCVFSVVFDKHAKKTDKERKFTVPVDRHNGQLYKAEIQNVLQEPYSLSVQWLERKIGQELITKIETIIGPRIDEVSTTNEQGQKDWDLDKLVVRMHDIVGDINDIAINIEHTILANRSPQPQDLSDLKGSLDQFLKEFKVFKKYALTKISKKIEEDNLEKLYEEYQTMVSGYFELLDHIRVGTLKNNDQFIDVIAQLVGMFGLKTIGNNYFLNRVLQEEKFFTKLLEQDPEEIKSAISNKEGTFSVEKASSEDGEITNQITITELLPMIGISSKEEPFKISKSKDFRVLIGLRLQSLDIIKLLNHNPKQKVLPCIRGYFNLSDLAHCYDAENVSSNFLDTDTGEDNRNFEFVDVSGSPILPEDWAYKAHQHVDVLDIIQDSFAYSDKIDELVELFSYFIIHCYENTDISKRIKHELIFHIPQHEEPIVSRLKKIKDISIFSIYEISLIYRYNKNVFDESNIKDLDYSWMETVPEEDEYNHFYPNLIKDKPLLKFFTTVVPGLMRHPESFHEGFQKYGFPFFQSIHKKIDEVPIQSIIDVVLFEYIYRSKGFDVKLVKDPDLRRFIKTFMRSFYELSKDFSVRHFQRRATDAHLEKTGREFIDQEFGQKLEIFSYQLYDMTNLFQEAMNVRGPEPNIMKKFEETIEDAFDAFEI